MKAVQMLGPDELAVQDAPQPHAGPGEVVVEVHSAALNHLDLWVLQGMRAEEMEFPHTLGSDAAGVVAETGDGVEEWLAGDEVVINPGLNCGACEFCRRGEHSECVDYGIVGMSRAGTFAERVSVPARCVAAKPQHLDYEHAAALPLDHLTSWRMLTTRAGLRSGETVLIHGIGGGVALASLQWAVLRGAEAIVTSSSDEKLAKARKLGATHTINYSHADDVAEAVLEITGGRGVDVAVDAVGAATWPVDLASVRRGGRVVICGVTTGSEATTDLQALYWNQISVHGSTMGSEEEFRQMLRACCVGRLEPVVDSVRDLDQAEEALERMETGQQFGKLVLRVGEAARA